MTRPIFFLHDSGSTSSKFQRAFTVFAGARDFTVVTSPNDSVVATVLFAETATMPALENLVPKDKPVAVCVIADCCTYKPELTSCLQDHNVIHGLDMTASTEPSELMRWLDGFWASMDRDANLPSRFPQIVTVTPGGEVTGDASPKQTFYEGDLVGHELLTHPEYPRPSYLLTIDYRDAPISYQTGDHIVIMPENKDVNVQRLLKKLNANGDEIFTVTEDLSQLSYGATLYEIFKRRLGIQGLATRRFIATMALLAEDPNEAAELNEMATNMTKDSPYANSIRNVFSYIDVLEKFDSLRLSVSQAISAIPQMRPRMYSCSCSPLRHPTQVQLTFTLVTYPTADGATFEGTNTSYMANLKVGDKVLITTKPGARDPTLDTPGMKYVGVALGSGVALLRGIAQHFSLLKNDPPSSLLLYYGVRHKEKDYMFAKEFEEYSATGALDLHSAFSHDQEEFITPATLINQDPERLCKVLVDEPQAKFFYCGPAGPAINSILTAVQDAINKCRPDVVYEDLVAKMKAEKRWNAEAYTPAPDPENPFKI